MSLSLVCIVYPSFQSHKQLTDRSSEHNVSLQETLYSLREETKTAFDEAKSLEARWKDLEREQREVYQVNTVCPHGHSFDV